MESVRKEQNYTLAAVAECVLNKKLLVKANSLDEAKQKAAKYLDNLLNLFSMFEVHQAVKDRELSSMNIEFVDCNDKNYRETAYTDKLIYTHLEVTYE